MIMVNPFLYQQAPMILPGQGKNRKRMFRYLFQGRRNVAHTFLTMNIKFEKQNSICYIKRKGAEDYAYFIS